MQLFYGKHDLNIGSVFSLQDDEFHHLKVLRKQVGDEIFVTNGNGLLVSASLLSITKNEALLRVQKMVSEQADKPWVSIALSPTKNTERFEWFLEKATELGVDQIFPLLCKRSERKKMKAERLEKILLSAMKQSNRLLLPKLHDLIDFHDFIKQNHISQCFIAHCEAENEKHLKQLCLPKQNTLVLIGPEGDFTEEEVMFAKNAGFKEVSLGKARLRVETAALSACHIVNLCNL